MYCIDQKKLHETMVERKVTMDEIASRLHIHRSTLYRRIVDGKLLLSDVYEMAQLLRLNWDETEAIFFAVNVANLQH